MLWRPRNDDLEKAPKALEVHFAIFSVGTTSPCLRSLVLQPLKRQVKRGLLLPPRVHLPLCLILCCDAQLVCNFRWCKKVTFKNYLDLISIFRVRSSETCS